MLLFWKEVISAGNKKRVHKSVEIFDLLSSFLIGQTPRGDPVVMLVDTWVCS